MTKAQQKELHNRVEEYNTQNVAVEYFKIRCLSGVAHNFVGGYCTNCGLKTETVFEPSDKRREFLHKMYLKVRKDEKKIQFILISPNIMIYFMNQLLKNGNLIK